MGYQYKEYPKSLYRIEPDGTRRERVFHSAEEVEPGWTDLAGLPVEPVLPLTSSEAVAAGKRLINLERENASMRDTIKLYEDETAAKDREIAALRQALAAQDAALDVRAEDGAEVGGEPKPKRKRAKA